MGNCYSFIKRYLRPPQSILSKISGELNEGNTLFALCFVEILLKIHRTHGLRFPGAHLSISGFRGFQSNTSEHILQANATIDELAAYAETIICQVASIDLSLAKEMVAKLIRPQN